MIGGCHVQHRNHRRSQPEHRQQQPGIAAAYPNLRLNAADAMRNIVAHSYIDVDLALSGRRCKVTCRQCVTTFLHSLLDWSWTSFRAGLHGRDGSAASAPWSGGLARLWGFS
jgi:hypothetical protein